jgi:hypothetical protein
MLLVLKWYLLYFFILYFKILAIPENCIWVKREHGPEVFWINMDKSVDRKVNMIQHYDEVGFRHYRVRGVVPRTIYIPDDIMMTWQTAWCKLQSDFIPPPRDQMNATSPYAKYSSVMSSLCGRGKKKNTLKVSIETTIF